MSTKVSHELREAVASTIAMMRASGVPDYGVAGMVIDQAQAKLIDDKRRLVAALRDLCDNAECHLNGCDDTEMEWSRARARALLEEMER